MADVRELVLARLEAILPEIDGIGKFYRNEFQVSDTHDVAVLLDGDEETNDDDLKQGRPNDSLRRVVMSPEIYVLLARKAATVGTALNLYRARLIKAIVEDATLATILGTNGKIVYTGTATDLGRGRTMLGEMGIGFDFHYFLRPSEL